VEKVSEVVSEAENVPSGDSEAVAKQCHEHIDHSNEQETEQLIARIHAAMAEDCDCPRHRAGVAEIDPAVLERISTAITRDQTFASLTTVRAAIHDVIDKGSFSGWWELYDEGDNPEVTEDMVNQERCDFVDAVNARVLELQREPHEMDAELRVAATALHRREIEVRAEERTRAQGIVDQIYGCHTHNQPTHCVDCALRHKAKAAIRHASETTTIADAARSERP
jgi:hypothetical protein